jgi:hypothetical protein
VLCRHGLATVYHYLFDLPAPYELPSLPKMLGALGGVSLMMGTAGLWMLNRARHPLHGDAAKAHGPGLHRPAVPGGRSGLALWLGRGTPALALLLCLHLGAVMALFATLPYGKFAHGVFRTAALLRHNTKAPAQPHRPGRRLSRTGPQAPCRACFPPPQNENIPPGDPMKRRTLIQSSARWPAPAC